MEQVQLIEGLNSIGTGEYLENKGITVKSVGEIIDYSKGPIIIQNPDPEQLQTLINFASEQTGLLIDNTNLDYGEHDIGYPFSFDRYENVGEEYKVITVNIPEKYFEDVRNKIRNVVEGTGFVIDCHVTCTNPDIINEIIYKILLLDIMNGNYKFISNFASEILD